MEQGDAASLLGFLSGLCYSCRRGSFRLHPVYVVLRITTQSAHQAQTQSKKRSSRAGRWHVGHEAFSHLGAAARPTQCCSTSQLCVPGDARPSPRAHLGTVQETHHRLQAEPTEKEVFNSTLKEDEKLRGGLVKCQRQMKRSQTKT